MKPTFVQKILSYFYPIRISKESSNFNPFLELCLYKGQWQLTTKDAIYSDGDRYRPLKLAFSKIKHNLPHVKSALVLGTGLGSAFTILDKMGVHPEMDLVEIDNTVIQWAKELLPEKASSKLRFICADAKKFIVENDKMYDLIIVDIFISRIVPDFVKEKEFLCRCKKLLSYEGILIMNNINNEQHAFRPLEKTMEELFPKYSMHQLGINSIFIARTTDN